MNEIYTRALIETRAGEMGTPLRFVASTEDVARDGMIIEAAGWQLDNYRRNPVVLWSHDYMGNHAPIGRADAFVDGARLVADITFDPNDPFAVSIERKYRDGFLSAVSVGWRTLETAPSQNPKVYGVIKRADLLDISAVPVPSDPKALKERQARGYESLQNQLNELLHPEEVTPSDDVEWEQAATAMVDLFVARASVDEKDALKRYQQLVKQYRKLGKVAPEWQDITNTALNDIETIRGLFLEGETEMFPDKFAIHARKGAVLSARNLSDLMQAIDLINGVIDRAQKESEQEPRAVDDSETMARQLLDALNASGLTK